MYTFWHIFSFVITHNFHFLLPFSFFHPIHNCMSFTNPVAFKFLKLYACVMDILLNLFPVFILHFHKLLHPIKYMKLLVAKHGPNSSRTSIVFGCIWQGIVCKDHSLFPNFSFFMQNNTGFFLFVFLNSFHNWVMFLGQLHVLHFCCEYIFSIKFLLSPVLSR